MPAKVDELFKDIKKSNPSYSDEQAWATAWSVFCKHVSPGSDSCHKPTNEYLKGKKAEMGPMVNRVVARYMSARMPIEPNIIRSAKSMLEEMQEAEAKMHRAVQFSRQLRTEPAMEWILDQLEEQHSNFSELVKSAGEALDYVTRE